MPRRERRIINHSFPGLSGTSALAIDRPIPELLKIDSETPLDISTDGKQLVIAPAKPSARRKRFKAAQEFADKHYEKAFRKSAE